MSEQNTSGFYKAQTDEGGTILIYGPNGVFSSEYDLVRELHTTYEYPIGGWYWFDSEQEAKQFFSITD